jgi:diguanylate cyclase (GGDEF)-like protein
MRVPHHFTAGEVRLLTAVANQAASAIERAQLYQMVNDSLQRRVTELAVLHEISRSGVGGLGQEHVLRHLRETVARHPIYPIMELGLYDPVAGLITIYPLHGVEVAQLTYSQIPVDQGIMGWVVHHGEAVNSGDVRGDPRYLACTAGTRSEVCVPLRAGDKIIGALNVESPRPHAFTDADVRFLTTLASHMAVMLDNAILHEGLQQHIRNLRSLQDVSRALVTRLASAELYEGVVDHAQRIFAADATSLMLWDDRGESLRIVAARGLSPEYQQAQRIPRARVEEVIAQRGEAAPLLVRDLQQTPYGDANMVVAEDLRSVLSLPIRRSRTLVSILNIYSKGKPRVFTDHEVDLAQLYADEIAVVMENISLYEDLKGKAEQLAILNAVGIAVTSTLKLDEVLWTVYEQVQPLVRQDSFAVAIYDEIQEALVFPLRVEHGTIMFEPLVINLRSEPLTLTGWVLRTQRPLLLHDLNDPSEEKPPVRILQVGEPTRSWLGVPLVFQGRAMGAMIVQSHQPHAFNERDQFLLSTLASYTAVAIENARLHESLVEQARRDSLTQCYTHGYFLTRLDEEVRRAGETGRPLSLIMLDVDYFKEFNDHYGHVTGDAILQAIVQSIRGNIKKTDVVGRWGGEEFGIILPNATSEQARMVAERIRHTVAGVAMTDRSGRPIRPPTISQGIATYPDQADSAIGLVDRADQVLYVAKARGRDQIEVAA